MKEKRVEARYCRDFVFGFKDRRNRRGVIILTSCREAVGQVGDSAADAGTITKRICLLIDGENTVDGC